MKKNILKRVTLTKLPGEISLYALWPPMTLSLPITKIKDIAVNAKVKVNSEFTMY